MVGNGVISQLYAQLVEDELEREVLTTGARGSTAAHPDVERLDGLIASAHLEITDAAASHLLSLDARIAALGDLRQR